jgi:hypothetical protein
MEPAINSDTCANTTRQSPLSHFLKARTVGPVAASNPASRLVYDELASPQEMSVDARAAGQNLRLPALDPSALQGAAEAAVNPAPSLRYEDYPAEVAKPEIRVSEAAARLANALHLHVD